MKSVLAIMLVISFLAQHATKFIIVINYTANKEFIAKNLCEQKDVAQSTCEGKCHLRKQLEKEEKKEKTPANPLQEKFEVQNVTEYESWMRNTDILQLSLVADKSTNSYSFSFIREIYHPPSFG